MKTLLFCVLVLLSAGIALPQAAPSPEKGASHPIIMIGDSITAQGRWTEVLHRSDVTNWGIPGYTTGQLAWTFKDLMPQQPRLCFLAGGINDLTLGVPAERIYQNQVDAIGFFRAKNVIPVLQAVLYQVDNPPTNQVIKQLNARLQAFCEVNRVDFIDLNAVLSEHDGLKKELSTDGTHLKPEAYVIWAKEVEKVLRKYQL